jgi:hypothetical protein
MQTRAAALGDLAAGALDPSVDAERLFDAPAPWLDAGLSAALAGNPAPAAASDLAAAYAAFFSRSEAEREALLRGHADAREAAVRAADGDRRRNELARQLETRSSQIDALLSGTLSLDLDPAVVLRIDLREGFPVHQADPSEPSDSSPSAQTDAIRRLGAARGELAKRVQRVLSLSPAQRDGLIAQHAERVRAAEEIEAAAAQEAEERAREDAQTREQEEALAAARAEAQRAEQDRAVALEASEQAETATRQLIEAERARLLGVKAEQADLEAQLVQREQAHAEERDGALAWIPKVAAIEEAARGFVDVSAQADAAYPEIRQALTVVRAGLRGQLEALSADGPEVPTPGATPPGLDDVEVETLRDDLAGAAVVLRSRVRRERWEHAGQLLDSMEALNEARLRLLALASPGFRAEITGFGALGVDQVRRELEQIMLSARYEGLHLPRTVSEVRSHVRAAPVPAIGAAFSVVVAWLVLRWWRRIAPALITGSRRRLREGGSVARAIGTGLWYVGRIRRPLELMAFSLFALHAIRDLEALPGLELARLVVIWLAAGSAAILWVDAFAHRQGSAARDVEVVRLRSLRLMGLAIAWVGLSLSLAAAIVGHGALYTWVLRLCWLLLIPILGLIFYWWRPIVMRRLERVKETDSLARWVLAENETWRAPVASAVGGTVLFLRGSRATAVRLASANEATRSLLAYLFRREVAKKAEEVSHHTYSPLPPDEGAMLRRMGAHLDVGMDIIDELEALADAPRTTVTALVGERGLGRSTILRQVQERRAGDVLLIECPKGDFDDLARALGEALRMEGEPTDEEIAAALASRAPVTVCIDDLQRIVRPALGGLAALDRLARLASAPAGRPRTDAEENPEDVAGDVSWIATMNDAAWQFVERARSGRVFFDRVIELPRWTERQIGRLLESRAESTGLNPDFRGLDLPRQLDEGHIDEQERNRLGFMRIAWDHSRGNPAAAVEEWARSLMYDEAGTLHVRLPPPRREKELDAAPQSVQFVLRALVQLGQGRREDIRACTRMPRADVDDALRFAFAREYVHDRGGLLSIPMDHFRAVTNMLARQHLLVLP